MNRKRLLTILAAATAALALHVGPAVALDVNIDTSDGLKAQVDVCDDDTAKLAAKIEADCPGVEVKSGDTKSDAEKKTQSTTESTKDTVSKTTDTAKETVKRTTEKATGGSGDSTGGDSGSSGGSSSSNDSKSGSSGGTSSSSDSKSSKSSDDDVRTASRAQMAFGTQDGAPTAAMNRLSGIEFSSSGASQRPGLGGGITPAFSLADFDPDAEFQEPLIAAPGGDFTSASGDGSQSDDVAAPQVATPPSTEAELATSPTSDGSGNVPAGLKLLAASLLAGTGAVWHMARREVGLR
jgi:hypothetical protein